MKLDIIIPVLNEFSGIGRALKSLQPLRAHGHKVIVVDGGSTDRTTDACDGLVDEVRVCPPGRARQMNRGAEGQQGDILVFLHADTTLPDDAESSLDRFFTSDLVWGRFDVRLSGRGFSLRVIERMMNWRSRLTGIATGDQVIFVRRNVFEILGGYADLALMEDIELSSRLRDCSRPFCIGSPVVTSSRRWEEKGVWKTVLLMWRLRLAYWCGVSPAKLAKRYHGPG